MNMSWSRFIATSFAVASLWCVPRSLGQSTFGAITGTVTDPTGALVPAADVTVTNEDTGLERKVITSSGGVFNAPNLDIGNYRVTVNAAGFARYERGGLAVRSNQVVNVDAKLEIGTTATFTEIRAAAPVISTETSALGDSK